MSITGPSIVDAEILPLELEALRFEVGGQVLLRKVSARIEAGPPSVMLGPNGAGKSLTLRLAHGLLQPTAGHVRWRGRAAREGRDRAVRLRQAMVFERVVLLRRSVLANVEYALALQGIARAERRSRAREVLERTGLAGLAERAARVLSAGEQQRLSLARAWAIAPEVLFLDEPTASLDPSATRAIEQLIEDISESGTKIVMTTHDLAQARRLAGDVLFLADGQLLEHTAAADFFAAPKTEQASAFLRGELLW